MAEDSSYIHDFFKDLYEQEITRKDKLDALDSFLLAVVTVVGSVAVFLARLVPIDHFWVATINVCFALIAALLVLGGRFEFHRPMNYLFLFVMSFLPSLVTFWVAIGLSDRPEALFVSLTGTFAGYYFAAVLVLLLSVFPRESSYMAYPKEYADYIENLVAHYGFQQFEREKEICRAAILSDLKPAVRDHYVRSGNTNRIRNLAKVKHQGLCRYFLSVCVLTMLFNAVPAYIIEKRQSKVQEVKIIDYPDRR